MQFPFPLAIIEDQAPIREALQKYLCAQPEFRCVLVADSVEAFLRGLPVAAIPPQLILSDIGLPGLTGIEGIPLIQEQLPQAQILMLSVFADTERVFQALRAGAVGYLLKSTPLAQLKEHLLQVAAGGSPMSPGVARFVVQAFQRRPTARPDVTLPSCYPTSPSRRGNWKSCAALRMASATSSSPTVTSSASIPCATTFATCTASCKSILRAS